MIKEVSDKIIQELKKKYDGDFVYVNDTFDTIIFNNQDLDGNQEFIDYSLSLAAKYLSKKDQLNFAVCYDYLNQIPMIKDNITNYKEIDMIQELLKLYGNNFNFAYNSDSNFNHMQLIAMAKPNVILTDDILKSLEQSIDQLFNEDSYCKKFTFFDSIVLDTKSIIESNNKIIKSLVNDNIIETTYGTSLKELWKDMDKVNKERNENFIISISKIINNIIDNILDIEYPINMIIDSLETRELFKEYGLNDITVGVKKKSEIDGQLIMFYYKGHKIEISKYEHPLRLGNLIIFKECIKQDTYEPDLSKLLNIKEND